ncbi:unnamed protein product [Rotaria sp. Silwood1]|nr:unnamed protein product [Rotaria sp. Silwood1]CAF1055289.1 unnamed protein product [Rotaria sp. Silwood1]CAF3423633.1 unnamed protein product [Rotaria sp. Silwood1]CAF3431515.1 unnamed protein product [Rotaria sp. Silwood1]CAF4567958.1 unnamed protein product [Rotaria sp. Silwood1]
MEATVNKTKLKFHMCTDRRLSLEHEINENIRKKNHLSNLNNHKYREHLFNKKLDCLRKTLENIEPNVHNDNNDEQALMAPNCFSRIQNHFRLLNFSSESEKRLLCQAPSYNKSTKQISNQLPIIIQKQNSNELNQCIRRVSFYQSRLPTNYSCHSAINHHFSNGDLLQQKTFQSYVNQQKIGEQNKQMKNNERKTFLLKEFDELKHTIDDPHSTLSVLAALSRAILFLDSGRK